MRRLGLSACALLVWMHVAVKPARCADDDPQVLGYGRHLASECTTCHRIDGADNGIPSITGWTAETFITTMTYYRSGARTNQVMASVVQSLNDAQIRALAAYWGSLQKPARK